MGNKCSTLWNTVRLIGTVTSCVGAKYKDGDHVTAIRILPDKGKGEILLIGRHEVGKVAAELLKEGQQIAIEGRLLNTPLNGVHVETDELVVLGKREDK